MAPTSWPQAFSCTSWWIIHFCDLWSTIMSTFSFWLYYLPQDWMRNNRNLAGGTKLQWNDFDLLYKPMDSCSTLQIWKKRSKKKLSSKSKTSKTPVVKDLCYTCYTMASFKHWFCLKLSSVLICCLIIHLFERVLLFVIFFTFTLYKI